MKRPGRRGQTAETLSFSLGPTEACIMPFLSVPAKTVLLSTAHSQGAESADAANGDGNRRTPGEQIAFQEIVLWGRGDPTRSDCTCREPLSSKRPSSARSPPPPTPNPAPTQRQNQGSPAHQRVPASSSDSHEQSHILSPWGLREKVDLPPTLYAPAVCSRA